MAQRRRPGSPAPDTQGDCSAKPGSAAPQGHHDAREIELDSDESADPPVNRERSRALGVAETLRESTRKLHERAERSGIVRDILDGRARAADYALYLRNLLPAYEALERGIIGDRASPIGRIVLRDGLFRSRRIVSDLRELGGPDWARTLALLPAGRRYADVVKEAARHGGPRLAAHAYVRYLGDLSGGQILAHLLARSMALRADQLRWLEFSEVGDMRATKAEFRSALESTPRHETDVEDLVAEAMGAFQLNIEVSESVRGIAQPL